MGSVEREINTIDSRLLPLSSIYFIFLAMYNIKNFLLHFSKNKKKVKSSVNFFFFWFSLINIMQKFEHIVRNQMTGGE